MEHAADIHGEIRVLGPSGIEDYHAHLMRLDRESRFPGLDDAGIDAHCLGLAAGGAILAGLYVDGAMRAGAQIVPDRTARRAQAAITVEDGYAGRGLERALIARVVEEAKRHRLYELTVLSQTETQSFRSPALAIAV